MPLAGNKFNRRDRGTAMLIRANGRPADHGGTPSRPQGVGSGRPRTRQTSARRRLDPRWDFAKECLARPAPPKGRDVTIPADERSRTRSDLAWAISVGGI